MVWAGAPCHCKVCVRWTNAVLTWELLAFCSQGPSACTHKTLQGCPRCAHSHLRWPGKLNYVPFRRGACNSAIEMHGKQTVESSTVTDDQHMLR